MDSGAVVDEIDKGNNKSSPLSSKRVSRSYSPISFYKADSDVKHPGPIIKGNNVPLSLYNTTVVYQPAPGPMGESKMDIFVSNKETPSALRKYRQISFYFYKDPNFSISGVRINYIPVSIPPIAFSMFSDSDSDYDDLYHSSSESESDFDFDHSSSSSIFDSHSSEESSSMSESKVTFGSIDFHSSESSESISDSKVIFTCFASSKSKVIPDKLAFSILSKLSVKSLKRFGCVRKSWSILFQNTHFMTMYATHFISRHGSHHDYHTFIHLNCIADQDLHFSEFYLLKINILQLNLSYPLQQSPYGTCILGSTSVNGIFCIGQPFPNLMPNSRYTLWNPLTKEFKEVPPSPAVVSPVDPEADIHLEHIFHGFGYDKLRDDFKVIQYVSFDDLFGNHTFGLPTSFFEIYSLKSNSWRMIHMDKDLHHRHYDFSEATSFDALEVYVDGACHWLVLGPPKHHVITVSLLSFDLSHEVFVTTPIGEELYSPRFPDHRLTVLNESIALISNYHDDIVFHISILGELGVSESWIKLYTYGPVPSIHWPPIGFGKMGYMFVEKNDYKVACVDLSTQIIEEFGIIALGRCSIVGLYKESLRRIK